MHFNGPIVRPPTDANSIFVEVTVGCTHNKCSFCNFYDGFPFRVASMQQIEADLREAHHRWPRQKHIWASGGNPFALSPTKLIEIGKLMQKYIPGAAISTYARIDDLKRKSVDDLKRIKAVGFNNIVIGVESGDDEALRFMNKGYTASDILEGCKKLEEAGILYRIIYLGGIAGRGKGVESARRSAELFNKLHPHFMFLTTVSVLPDTKLYDQILLGEFVEETEKERIEEFYALLDTMKNPIQVFAQSVTVTTPFIASMPRDKHKVLGMLRNAADSITEADEERILSYRRRQTSV